MHRHEVVLTNDRVETQIVILEPCGMELGLPPGESLRVVGLGAEPGALDVERERNGWMIFYWDTLEVWRGDRLVYDQNIPFPALPEGMSVREFFAVVGFHGPTGSPADVPVATARPTESQTRRLWLIGAIALTACAAALIAAWLWR